MPNHGNPRTLWVQRTHGVRRRCTSLKADGTPCKAWAMRDTMPALCVTHAARTTAADANPGIGMPSGSANSQSSPSPEMIEKVIDDLAGKQAQLSAYITERLDQGADVQGLARVFALHGQNASRLGRLLRDQRALSGDAADGIAGAIAQALDELSTELGADL
ncbi:MAG: hypothetical protein MUQ10_08625 [Anaerolineae bacterium]|nr:hypothetical protein [Anaerolineae bacterium]